MTEFLAWSIVCLLGLRIAWDAQERRDLLDELTRYRDVEDVRRGIAVVQETCEECGIDIEGGGYCASCWRLIEKSGDH